MKKTPFLVLFGLAAIFGQTQTSLDSVLANYYKALGGLDKLNAVKTMRVEGKSILPKMNLGVDMILYVSKPNKFRVETVSHGMKSIKAYDGRIVWTKNGNQDAIAYSEQISKVMKSEMDLEGPLVNWKAKGNDLKYLGTEIVEGVAAHKIKVLEYTGREYVYYLHPETYLPLLFVMTRAEDQRTPLMSTQIVEYADVKGLKFPAILKLTDKHGNLVISTLFEKYELDGPVESQLFEFPDAKEKAFH
ncbi:MAG: hypothetical protein CR997_07535 [Acidobacteria bacterium]|nr:MAG: hypothetical protein CR997_07535 [Acidobacteriota bacterium]